MRTEQRPALERFGIPTALLGFAAIGWWWSVRMAAGPSGAHGGSMGAMASHSMSFGAFIVAWLAMMTAMMFPAIAPVVQLYVRGASAGRVAPTPFFVGGYIAVWTGIGVPSYLAWRALMDPVADGRRWAGVLAGCVLIAAAVWQLTPLKSMCLRHCRSPMSVFLRFGSSATRPVGAARMGATHGAYCIGCCWALMAVLVAVGTMNLAWMLGLAVLILLEKTARFGERVAAAAAAAMAALGFAFLVHPGSFELLT